MKKSDPVQMDVFGGNWTLKLTNDEKTLLRRRIEPGEWGGNQRLAHLLQSRERRGELAITDEELASAFTKAYAYGNGTWQRYFRAIVEAGKRAGWTPTESLLNHVRQHRDEVFERGHQKRRQRHA
jgi:hypothetical protein